MAIEPAEVRRLLVVLPSWVGDVVMATPTLRALGELYPAATTAYLMRPSVQPVIDAAPWCDETIAMPPEADRGAGGLMHLAGRLRAMRFDLAVLLPNSFRTALLARLAQIPRRLGYDRDGRGFLLTDRLIPLRGRGGYVPLPTLHYYLGLARYLGASAPSPAMQLFTRPADDRRADELLREAGVDPPSGSGSHSAGGPLVLLNPGANYGDAKMWPAERFAAVADALIDRRGATVLLNGAPKERAILDAVHAAARHDLIDLPRLGSNLTLLKSVIRRCDLMVTNDTGPRHLAAALGVPVVTIFGPTDPRWSEIDFAAERQVRIDVFCGPCQLKRCPLDHRCMTGVGPDLVVRQCEALLDRRAGDGDRAGDGAGAARMPPPAEAATERSVRS